MASQAQINANRQNSRKSTGPKTAAGRARVAKNAIKHGLCAAEAVIDGEDVREYELHRQSYLDEFEPVGVVETMLAERMASLTWRLRRAERMQNQAIDYKMMKTSQDPLLEVAQFALPRDVYNTMRDSRSQGMDLPLGRTMFRDLSNESVIEHLLLYERRLENSMLRTGRELERRQHRRRRLAELAAADEAAARKAAAETTECDLNKQSQTAGRRRDTGNKGNLNKQSQFDPALMGAMPCVAENYGDEASADGVENKANQSRFQVEGRPCESVTPEIASARRASQ